MTAPDIREVPAVSDFDHTVTEARQPSTRTGKKLVAMYGSRFLDDVLGIEYEARQDLCPCERCHTEREMAWQAAIGEAPR